MIVNDKSLIKSSEIGCFPTIEALYETLPRSIRLHMKRVGKYANILYTHMLSGNSLNVTEHMGNCFADYSQEIFELHDIGEHYIPFEVLNKVDGLNEEEIQTIRNHTIHARRAIKGIYIKPYPDQIMEQWEKIAVYHHERFDGQGYPEGIKGEEIPLGARICAIADTYDGIVSWKPYKKVQTTKEEAVEIIERESGGQFQPELVDVFKECLGSF